MTFDQVETYILSDGLDDWVMLGAVAEAAVAFGYGASTLAVRPQVLRAIDALLSKRLIYLGEVRKDGKFHQWEGSSEDLLQRLEQLLAVDDENTWYASAWVDLTELGTSVASALDSSY